MRIEYGDICMAQCDAIVNASNGIGFMGGKKGIRKRYPGVAESIHYITKGKVEEEAKKICSEKGILGIAPGNVFVTSAEGLYCSYVIHAVTMRYPGLLSDIKTVEILLPKIIEKARELKIKSIAIPLLGTGTGHVSKDKVLKLYEQAFASVRDIDVVVYMLKK